MEKLSHGKVFDHILKENLAASFLPILETLFSIKVLKMKDLPGTDKQQRTMEREPDFVQLVLLESGEEVILHLEFQTTNDSKMVERMLLYYGLMYLRHGIDVKQFVIYLGYLPMRMKYVLSKENIEYHYGLYNIKETNYQQWLAYDIPEVILLAVLAHLEEENPKRVLRAILYKLKKLVPDKSRLRRYINQLKILSRLPKLEEELIKEMDDMAITYNIKDDYLYQIGNKEGKVEGKIEGKIETVKKALSSQLFHSRTIDYKDIAELSGFSVEEIQRIHSEMKEGES